MLSKCSANWAPSPSDWGYILSHLSSSEVALRHGMKLWMIQLCWQNKVKHFCGSFSKQGNETRYFFFFLSQILVTLQLAYSGHISLLYRVKCSVLCFLSRLLKNLQYLGAGENNLTSIPPEIGKFSQVYLLHLGACRKMVACAKSYPAVIRMGLQGWSGELKQHDVVSVQLETHFGRECLNSSFWIHFQQYVVDVFWIDFDVFRSNYDHTDSEVPD